MELPKSVVREDRRLENATASAGEQLAELRWHWTLDETNAKRVSFTEYARGVGRDESTIREYAKGYALAHSGNIPLREGMKRSQMSAEREAATGAVAKARGLTFGTARQTRPAEVKRVTDMARERFEQQGGTIEEQAAKAADWIVKSERSEQKHQAARRERLGLRFIGIEERLQRVKRELTQAVNEAAAVGWGSDEQELLAQTLAQVRALLELLDMAIGGTADIDWDAELAGLEDR